MQFFIKNIFFRWVLIFKIHFAEELAHNIYNTETNFALGLTDRIGYLKCLNQEIILADIIGELVLTRTNFTKVCSPQTEHSRQHKMTRLNFLIHRLLGFPLKYEQLEKERISYY